MDWQQQAYELWGESWKATLAKTAQVNVRTVRRWSTGEINVRQDVVDSVDDTYNIWRA